MDCMSLTEHRDRWRSLVNTAPQNARNLFAGGGFVSLSGLTVLHGISYFSPSPGRM